VIEEKGFFGPEPPFAWKSRAFPGGSTADLMKMNAQFSVRCER
jgi:hypothetical protein